MTQTQSETQPETLVFLGVGQVARAVARWTPEHWRMVGTTRDASRHEALWRLRIEPVAWEDWAHAVSDVMPSACVLVSFPPDGHTDRGIVEATCNARRVVYLSSTGVYGQITGRVDDTTPVAAADPRAARRIEAENIWRSVGATVLRAPGIYGPEGGLHKRLMAGTFQLTGDGTNVISRIHVDDLARLILATFGKQTSGETYVVADRAPVSQREVVEWLCARLAVPFPKSIPAERAHATLRASREVDSSRALGELGVDLLYPTYKEGFSQLIELERTTG